jgi:hypothetical protein
LAALKVNCAKPVNAAGSDTPGATGAGSAATVQAPKVPVAGATKPVPVAWKLAVMVVPIAPPAPFGKLTAAGAAAVPGAGTIAMDAPGITPAHVIACVTGDAGGAVPL